MKKYKLGDIATVEISGVDKKITDGEKEIRLCNFVDVYYNWAITIAQHDSFMLATARPNEISKFQLKKGQVALTKDSETRYDIGIPTYIADDFEDVILGYHCALISPNKDILDGRYLNALLHTDYAKKYFACNASGSGQRYALSVEVLNSFPIPIIPLHEQKQIGEIFSALDKKIELNRQINQNLEAMAKQLYDYWFVQFDFPNEDGKPYKSSGGEMVWSEKLKREIPEGWDNCTLEYFLTIKNGRDHKHLAEGLYPVYGSGGEMRRVNENLYRGESVLMPRKGTLNNIMYVDEAFWTVDTMFYSEMKIPHCAKYIFFTIKDIDFTRWDSGTGVPSMTVSTFYTLSMVKPNKNLLKRFDKTLAPIFYKIKQIRVECEELIKQRDQLLPLLMNDQVSVNSDLSVFKKQRRGKIHSLTLNQVSDIQIFYCQSIILLSEQVLMDKFQAECLIILVVITFCTEVFVTVAWHVFLEETSQIFQAFGLVLLEVTTHNDDAPIGEVASSIAVLPKTDVAVQIALTDVHTKAIGILHHATTVSVAKLLTQVEIEIKNQIVLFHK